VQHRIIVVDALASLSPADAQRHWRERHPAVYLPVPHLLGYVQNRPLEEEWARLGTRSICSETWFADHAAERASFASAYYRETVMPDENAFLDRESAWMGRILEEPPWPAERPRYRVLAFGAELPGADVLRIDREPATVSSLWVDDRERALALARAVSAYAFAAEPAVFRLPSQ
jgi:hypothetical protein